MDRGQDGTNGKTKYGKYTQNHELYTLKKKINFIACGFYLINKMKQKECRQWFLDMYRPFGAILMFHILKNKFKEEKKTQNGIQIELNECLNFKWIINHTTQKQGGGIELRQLLNVTFWPFNVRLQPKRTVNSYCTPVSFFATQSEI